MSRVLLIAAVSISFAFGGIFAGEVYFSPKDNISNKIVNYIKNSNRSIDIMVYRITDNRISKELIHAKFKGVAVRLIVDSDKKGDFYNKKEEVFLKSRGIEVKRISGVKDGIMHNKVAIFDGRKVITGSYNWTIYADKYNYENILVSEEADVIRSYQREFDRLWFK